MRPHKPLLCDVRESSLQCGGCRVRSRLESKNYQAEPIMKTMQALVKKEAKDGIDRDFMRGLGILEGFDVGLETIKASGLWKSERVIASDQKNDITLADGSEVINMCANNYLGLANNREVIEAAKASYDTWGFGLSSVRFICGTQSIHKALEQKVSEFLGMEDTILYAACFDANTGLFETILNKEDAVVSDELNHASIIDGVRLCRALRLRYKNKDRLAENTRYFREGMKQAGFHIEDGEHPIVPVMLGEAELAQEMSRKLLERGIYAIGFFYPIVPEGKARIRTQISAAHTREDLDTAIEAFSQTYAELR